MTIIFLETAELRVKERKDIHLRFWQENVNRILEFNDKEVLQNAGSVSKSQMEEKVKKVYADFEKNRRKFDAEQADLDDLKIIEESIKNKKK